MPIEALAQSSVSEFGSDVFLGLTKAGQKEIPSKYLYDEVGSALFEVITELPEYGVFRADERLLRRNADTVAGTFMGGRVTVAELGSGSGRKTSSMLEALAKVRPVLYHPIEISQKALEQCSKELNTINNLTIKPLQCPYLEGLAFVARKRAPGERLLVLFLGGTIGNFDRPAAERFLIDVRRVLSNGDGLLLGADLEKPIHHLLAAYDDVLGVTAAFNLNLLARMNRELDAEFDVSTFRHLAHYNAEERRIEMHLVSLRAQTVEIPGAKCSVTFRQGETIWTESSHRYRASEIAELGRRSGFQFFDQWTDREWAFAETLLLAE